MTSTLLTPQGTPATVADRVLAVLAGATGGALIAIILLKGFVFVLN